jgi:NADPH:quinone reductase-like Zn-dependent oxidoreductase
MRLGLPWPERAPVSSNQQKESPVLLVWGGSSSVGQYAIQLGVVRMFFFVLISRSSRVKD